MREKTNARKGFSLIELLVVIAIIAILAAILFPVFNSVRENSRRTTCMTQMHSIWEATSLYHSDNQKYPDILLANPYITSGSTQVLYSGSGTPLDPDQVYARPLIKQRNTVPGKQTFTCPDRLITNPLGVTNASYPAKVPLTGTVKSNGVAEWFYLIDSYDIGPALDANGLPVSPTSYETHYQKDWTGVAGKTDPTNQLKYPNPPENNTVLTWCTDHCATAHTGIIPVIMLSGSAKPAPAKDFLQKGPLGYAP